MQNFQNAVVSNLVVAWSIFTSSPFRLLGFCTPSVRCTIIHLLLSPPRVAVVVFVAAVSWLLPHLSPCIAADAFVVASWLVPPVDCFFLKIMMLLPMLLCCDCFCCYVTTGLLLSFITTGCHFNFCCHCQLIIAMFHSICWLIVAAIMLLGQWAIVNGDTAFVTTSSSYPHWSLPLCCSPHAGGVASDT